MIAMAHAHGSSGRVPQRRLAVVLGITVSLMSIEAVGSLLTGSLTLLADAGHMLADAAAVGLALFAVWFASRPSPPHRTYGYHRVEILAALVNALLLAMVVLFVVIEAIHRLREPAPIRVAPMFVIGCLGLLGNLAGMRILHDHSRGNLNVRGAYLEVMADMLASLGVLASAALTFFLGWRRADPVLSLGIALFILPRIAQLLRETTDVLMEAAPRGMDLEAVRQSILEQEGVVAVHDLHVWTISSGRTVLSAHLVGRDDVDRDRVILAVNRTLRERFGLAHTTLQVEGESQAEFSGQRSEEACDPCAPPEGETARSRLEPRPGQSGVAGPGAGVL